MTLEDLKTFIAETRRREGVSWYLRDDSPLNALGVMYTLLVFDAAGGLVQEIPFIEERINRQVPPEQLTRVGATREGAGINPHFLRNFVDGPEAAKVHFETCRLKWLAGSREPMVLEGLRR